MSDRLDSIKAKILLACTKMNKLGIKITDDSEQVYFLDNGNSTIEVSPLPAVYFGDKSPQEIYRLIYEPSIEDNFNYSERELEELGGKILGMNDEEVYSFYDGFEKYEYNEYNVVESKTDPFYILGKAIADEILPSQKNQIMVEHTITRSKLE